MTAVEDDVVELTMIDAVVTVLHGEAETRADGGVVTGQCGIQKGADRQAQLMIAIAMLTVRAARRDHETMTLATIHRDDLAQPEVDDNTDIKMP
mmetsp:Transcript_11670/g.24067  ORF Transcript_11670/g.24067 Transcript_11670/m.24067 type:complete len:94 (+) Transcript_11670:2141-2422(+)